MSSSAAEDEWYADLAVLAAAQKKSDRSRKRLTALACFVVLAFLVLSYRSEVNSDRIDLNTRHIFETQQASCESSREILRKYNRQQDDLIALEQVNPGADAATRDGRIRAYRTARIDPLPVCDIFR